LQFTTRIGRLRAALTAVLLLLLAAPNVPADDDAVREYVDEITAVSITVTVDALVFARERSDLAANARDYITLAPLEINRTGQRSYFWSGYIWSTIDRRDREPVVGPGDQLMLLADGRPIRLLRDATPLRDRGVGQPPLRVPTRTAIPVLFSADPESIAYVSRASELHIELIHAGVNEPFPLWKDARKGIREFAERVGALK
jgi:hypothetical protein